MRFFVDIQTQLLVACMIAVLAACAVILIVMLMSGIVAGPRRNRVLGELDLICHSCKCRSVRPSFRSGFLDFFFGLLGCVPYRCEVCYWRFYVRRPGVRTTAG